MCWRWGGTHVVEARVKDDGTHTLFVDERMVAHHCLGIHVAHRGVRIRGHSAIRRPFGSGATAPSSCVWSVLWSLAPRPCHSMMVALQRPSALAAAG